MRILPGVAVLTACFTIGCASGGVPVNPDTPATVQAPQRAPVTFDGATNNPANMMIRPTGGEATERIVAAPPAIWQAVLKTYSKLGVIVTQIDTANMTVKVGSQRLRRVGGKSAGDLFSCTGAYENLAASGRVIGEFTTRVVPYTDGSTEVRTLVNATVSRNVGGDPMGCPSTGKLEQLIHQGIHRELADTVKH